VDFDNASNAVTHFPMPESDVTVTAVFAPIVIIADLDPIFYTVIVSSEGAGATGGGEYAEGEAVTINAGTPSDGQQFSHWTSVPDVDFDDPNNATASFTMPEANVEVKAVFEPLPETKEKKTEETITTSPNMPPTTETPATSAFVSVSAITGVPAFMTAGTSLNLTGSVSPSNATNQSIQWRIRSAGTTNATINGNRLTAPSAGTMLVTATVVNGLTPSANYTQDFYITVYSANAQTSQVTIQAGVGGFINWGASGQYMAGDIINIFAEAHNGYIFDRWTSSNGGSFAHANSTNTSFTVPNGATAITAHFTFVGAIGGTQIGSSGGRASSPALRPNPLHTRNNISHRRMNFDKDNPNDLVIEILPANPLFSFRRVRFGFYTLVEGVDYYRDGNKFIIKAEYLATLGRGDKIITFDMDNGGSPQVIVRML
jgi:hypothetical protein